MQQLLEAVAKQPPTCYVAVMVSHLHTQQHSHVANALALGGSLQGLLIELDSLTVAASSIATAIQLEHMEEQPDEEGHATQ